MHKYATLVIELSFEDYSQKVKNVHYQDSRILLGNILFGKWVFYWRDGVSQPKFLQLMKKNLVCYNSSLNGHVFSYLSDLPCFFHVSCPNTSEFHVDSCGCS